MATSNITVKVDATELVKAMQRIEQAYRSHAVWHAAPLPASLNGSAGAVAAGLVLAGSTTRKVTRRSLLSFGFLRGKR